jgi:hypothetical protein
VSITFFSPRDSTAAVCYENYTTDLVRKYPTYTFLFGDNLLGSGKASQAIIRDEPNTLGIPTKRAPSMASTAFMTGTPEDYAAVDQAFATVEALLAKKLVVVFPLTGLGTGLAKLNTIAPELLSYIDARVSKLIRADYSLLRITR